MIDCVTQLARRLRDLRPWLCRLADQPLFLRDPQSSINVTLRCKIEMG